VFRELADLPVGIVDYLLAAVQGVGSWLIFNQFQPPESRLIGWDMVSNALLFGPIAGVIGTWFYAQVYSRLSARMGRAATRAQVFHVLAYGGTPVAAGVILWSATALLLGDAMFADKATVNVDGFVWLLIHVQRAVSVALFLWSYLLQVMGLSEMSNQTVPKALAVWVLGQLLGAAAGVFLMLLLALLFPNMVPTSAT
jgi:hypothetical protein